MNKKTTLPRGIRNNNPLNIRLSATGWAGQVSKKEQTDKDFVQFQSMYWGLRAACILLFKTYKNKYGLRTIHGLIYRWAPPTENYSYLYAQKVVQRTGIGLDENIYCCDERLLMKRLQQIVIAMIECENGIVYNGEYDQDIMMAIAYALRA